MPALRAELMSVPYRPSTAMAKTNWRKRRNVVAMKSGKGREDWIAIFVYFFVYDVFVVSLYGKANRLGGTSAFVVGKKGGCGSFLRIEKVSYVGIGRVRGVSRNVR